MVSDKEIILYWNLFFNINSHWERITQKFLFEYFL